MKKSIMKMIDFSRMISLVRNGTKIILWEVSELIDTFPDLSCWLLNGKGKLRYKYLKKIDCYFTRNWHPLIDSVDIISGMFINS